MLYLQHNDRSANADWLQEADIDDTLGCLTWLKQRRTTVELGVLVGWRFLDKQGQGVPRRRNVTLLSAFVYISAARDLDLERRGSR